MNISKKIQKIPCGGFEFDDSLEIRDGKLSAKSALDAKQSKNFTITFTQSSDGTYTADKTFDELSAAISEGKSIVAVDKLENNSIKIYLILAQFVEGLGASFSGYQAIPNQSVIFSMIAISHDNNVTSQVVSIPLA